MRDTGEDENLSESGGSRAEFSENGPRKPPKHHKGGVVLCAEYGLVSYMAEMKRQAAESGTKRGERNGIPSTKTAQKGEGAQHG